MSASDASAAEAWYQGEGVVPEGVWSLQCASLHTSSVGEDGKDRLVSLNAHMGRQVWVYDTDAAPLDLVKKVRSLQASFTSNRHTCRHSSDELLRLQRKPFTGADDKLPARSSKSTRPSADVPTIDKHLKAGCEFFNGLQADDGHWPGDYGGPMFLMPGLIIATWVAEVEDEVFPPPAKIEVIRYLLNHQNEDGGFGLHIEGHSTMFGTVLSYVSLRLMGVDADHPAAKTAREWIKERGGATYITSWGKFWLSILAVYDWRGQNPLTPEMWLMPYSFCGIPNYLHPGRFWCHCRMVYLPMSYLYGVRACPKFTNPHKWRLIHTLRTEIFVEAFDDIDWNKARNQCAKEDLYYPHPPLQDAVWYTLDCLEDVLHHSFVRRWANEEVLRHVRYEDENTRYIDIGPVNKVINMLVRYFAGDMDGFRMHIPRIYDYLWVAEDGMKMQGYNGSQLWDTAFAVQALSSTGLHIDCARAIYRAHTYMKETQVREDCPKLERYYRHISKGAWPFSTRDHGWPISDCTAEGLKACLGMGGLLNVGIDVGIMLPIERLRDAVDVILSFQNFNGGCATYENTRSFEALELINPAETFGDIIVDYSYVECTSACMQALGAFSKFDAFYRCAHVASFLRRAEQYILRNQRDDGSWYGSWGVCFTYAIWFGCCGLSAVPRKTLGKKGATQCFAPQTVKGALAMRRAIIFLLDKQRADGGWGESYLSCQDKVYSQIEPPDAPSHIVMTSWAMLAMMQANIAWDTTCLAGVEPYAELASDAENLARRVPQALAAGARFLMHMQERNGDWPQQSISGVFNRNCMISYSQYRNIFPIWALGEFKKALKVQS